MLLALGMPALAAGEALPDVAAYLSAEDATPVTPEGCGQTLRLHDGVNTITRGGVYHVQGACSGQLVVDAADEAVFLLLDGVTIASPDGPAIHIAAAGKAVITLAADTQSALTDGAVYTLPQGEDEPNGALFSKDDLTINGAGALRVVAQYDDGIVSKDSLVIAGGRIDVQSRGDAIRGKDSVLLYGAALTLDAGKDGVKSTNDQDAARGWVYALGSTLTIRAQEDGIQAETELYLGEGTYAITSGGGCRPEYRQELAAPVRRGDYAVQVEAQEDEAEADMANGKGLKAARIHVAAGAFSVSSRDDALHADGSIAITESFEGIEAAHILLCGGRTDVQAIDDGWNAASKAQTQAQGGKRTGNHDFSITVSGGEHTILAGADAIDSNGSILISGGVTLASTSNTEKEVAIDYSEVCACRITGGTLLASGGYGRNTQTFSAAENQACITLKWRAQQPAGTMVSLSVDGGEPLTFVPTAPFTSIVASFPALQVGSALNVQTDGGDGCTRTLTEAISRFPVTPGRRDAQAGRAAQTARDTQTAQAAQTAQTAQAAQTAASVYGSMTAHPAADGRLGYWLYAPRDAGDEALPLIVYLHGGSGKGDDLSRITDADGFPNDAQAGRLGDIRAYVLCPQCPQESRGWREIADRVFALVDEVCASLPVDASRVALTGHSMGGTGTWALAALAPMRFSRIAPMSGSVACTPENLSALADVPVWAFVGGADSVVDPAASEAFITQLAAVNPDARLTVFDGAGHRDVPGLAWRNEALGLLDWLLGSKN